jgi:hypothetical protein
MTYTIKIEGEAASLHNCALKAPSPLAGEGRDEGFYKMPPHLNPLPLERARKKKLPS